MASVRCGPARRTRRSRLAPASFFRTDRCIAWKTAVMARCVSSAFSIRPAVRRCDTARSAVGNSGRHVPYPFPMGAMTLDDDRFAAQLRGFGPIGLLAVLVVLAGNAIVISFSGVLVLVWVKLSRTPWSEIGYVRPRSWVATIAGGIFFGIAFKFALKAIVMPLLGADPVNHAYHYLTRNRAAIPFALFALIIGAGFGEETVFRGFL